MLEVKDPVHTRRRLQTVVLILVLKTACSRGTKKAFIYRLHLMAEKKKNSSLPFNWLYVF